MNTTCARAAATLGLAAVLVLPVVEASAADFRIRLSRIQGKQVAIYHDAPNVDATADVEIHIGATTCRALSGETLKPLRGGDTMTTLIVLDRGGTPRSGMGQHTDAIRTAVGGFLETIVGKGPGDRVAIVDTPGRDKEPGRLPPTRKIVDVKGFLSNLPESSGSGADIYGTANLALSELDKGASRLGAVILISDGIDPTAIKDPAAVDNHKRFIQEARRRGVPVAAIHVGRSGERKNDDATRFRNGRARLQEVANQTNGDFRSIDSKDDLTRNLRLVLDNLGSTYAKVMRTTCQVCGETAAKKAAILDVQIVKAGKTLARSLVSPPPTMDLPGDNYGSCDAVVAKASSGATDDSAAGATSCKMDPDCPVDSKCEAGACVKRKTMRDLLPWAAGGFLGLSALLLLLGLRRKSQRQRQAAEAAAEEARHAAEQAQADKERARQQLAQERSRVQRLETEVQAQTTAKAPPAPTTGLRLAAAAGSVEHVDRVFGPGSYLVGSEEDCDLKLTTSTVSGHHLQLTVDASGRAEILDLASSNGTFVNEVPIAARQPIEIQAGDVIGLSRQVQIQVFALDSGAPGRAPGRGRTRIEE